RSAAAMWLVGFFVAILLLVGGALFLETLLGNPFKTSFVSQPQATPLPANTRTVQATSAPATVAQATGPASRDQVANFLNNGDLYGGRVLDVGLTAPDVLQLRLKLAGNGMVLNS